MFSLPAFLPAISAILFPVAYFFLAVVPGVASPGLGEWEDDLGDGFVLSNSDVYDHEGRTPVLIIREKEGERGKVLLSSLYQACSRGGYIIGSSWPSDTASYRYFLLNKSTLAVETFTDTQSVNRRAWELNLIPFYGRPFFSSGKDIMNQLRFAEQVKWTCILTAGFVFFFFFQFRWMHRRGRSEGERGG